MTRGKYAAKAANRLAELDNETIADLRTKVAAVTAERNEARQEAARLRDKLATEVDRAARDLSAKRIEEVTRDLVAEREARAEARERLGEQAFAVFDKHGMWPQPAVMADLAAAFGLSRRIGQVIRPDGGNRHSRRTNAGKLRHIQASIDANDRQI